MNFSSIRRITDAACRIYAICTLSLCAFQMLLSEGETIIHPLSFFLLFPFALCFAWANSILRSTAASPAARFFGHFALLTAGIMLFVFWPAGVFAAGSSALIMVCLYLLFYFLTMLTISALRTALHRKKKEQTETYSAQYRELRDRK